MRARSALFTLFGDVVRPAGGQAWLTTITACMQTLEFTPEATRTALHRMAAEGWVAQTKVGRFAAYHLTERGVERLDEAAARIYRLRAVDWDRRWHILVSPGAGRHAAVARELQWRGYGRLSADVWVTPHPQHRTRQLLTEHRLLGTHFEHAVTPGTDDDSILVGRAWDLTRLREAHEEFIERWESAPPPGDDEDAFATRLHLVHHWRSFLFLDPGLPHQLLPDDWLGDRAAEAFRTVSNAVDDGASSYYASLLADAPPLPDLSDGDGDVGSAPPAGETPPVAHLDILQTSR